MDQTTPRLHTLVAQFVAAREEVKQIESQAKAAKDRAKELTEAIKLEMASQGLASANLDGIARVVISDKPHYEIVDPEAFALYSLEKMVSSFRRGGMLSDGILLQRKISREAIESHNNGDPLSEAECQRAGVRYVVDNTLTVRSN